MLKQLKKRYVALVMALLCVIAGLLNQNLVFGKIALNKSSITISVGEQKQLTLKGTKKKVTWKSENKKIATVTKKGKVTGKAVGKTTITATSNGKRYKCKVKVKEVQKTSTAVATQVPGVTATAKATDSVQKTPTAVATQLPSVTTTPEATGEPQVQENGSYDSKECVALYLELYHKLPSNYITKKEAKELGWQGGGLDPYKDGACIGGDYFGNYEKALPTEKGRKYYECDIDTMHASSRGAKRIVYSNDGYIYYTEDHYTTFTLIKQVDAQLAGE